MLGVNASLDVNCVANGLQVVLAGSTKFIRLMKLVRLIKFVKLMTLVRLMMLVKLLREWW